jgi:DNA replication protein DnaC
MMMNNEIEELLISLRLHGMKKCFDEVLSNAEHNGIAIEDTLLHLLKEEYRYKQELSIDNRVKNAKLPWPWTLKSFPFEQQPAINKTQIMGLAKLNFIQNNENIVFVGKPGRGKTGLAIGLLQLAALNGYRCRFYNAQEMLDELYTSLADRSTSKLLNKLYNYSVIVIDELGYLSLNSEQVNIFFKLIDMRYQKRSTIITTNLHYSAWYDVFKNKELVDALLDRFRHRCTTIDIDGDSLRTPNNGDDDQNKTK